MNILESIVNVKITKPQPSLTAGDFGTLLIIGKSKGKVRVKKYSNLVEVGKDFESSTDEYKAASLAFGQHSKIDSILIGQVFEEESYCDAYKLIAKENNAFYAVMICSKDEKDQLAISELIETSSKIFAISSNDENMLNGKNTDNILHKLNSANKQRTFIFYNSSADTGVFPEAAWFGLMLTKPPGSGTWSFKSLSGFSADNLSSDEINSLDSKNGNYFVDFGGRDVSLTGKMANGEWIDTIRGLDWVTNHLQIQVGNALINSDKIPFNNQGVAIIQAALRTTLYLAAEMDIIDKDSIKIIAPDVRLLSASDKQQRCLKGVKFEAVLTGAVHTIKIQGSLTN